MRKSINEVLQTHNLQLHKSQTKQLTLVRQPRTPNRQCLLEVAYHDHSHALLTSCSMGLGVLFSVTIHSLLDETSSNYILLKHVIVVGCELNLLLKIEREELVVRQHKEEIDEEELDRDGHRERWKVTGNKVTGDKEDHEVCF